MIVECVKCGTQRILRTDAKGGHLVIQRCILPDAITLVTSFWLTVETSKPWI